jgi:predicted ribosomally synthesized peptide with nif11-like leader
MSKEQLAALLAKLQNDEGLQEKLKGTADLDAFIAIAKEAGFVVSKADWLRYQAIQTLGLSDDELGEVAGGNISSPLASRHIHDRLARRIRANINRFPQA